MGGRASGSNVIAAFLFATTRETTALDGSDGLGFLVDNFKTGQRNAYHITPPGVQPV